MVHRNEHVGGEFLPASEANISILDHAASYGDRVFETAFAWKGRIFKLDAHIERGFRSMAAIAPLAPPVDRQELARVIVETGRRDQLQDAHIKSRVQL